MPEDDMTSHDTTDSSNISDSNISDGNVTDGNIADGDPLTRHRLPRITHVADLFAAVPTLLGFYPHNSVVVVFLRAGQVRVTLRADLADPDLADPDHADPDHVGDLVRTVITDPITAVPGHDAVAIVVVSPTRRPDVGLALETAALAHGVRVLTVVGVSVIEAGARWECAATCRCHVIDHGEDGDQQTCGGELPDPHFTPSAVEAVINRGVITAASRDELWQRLAPVDPATLQRRARLLDPTPHDQAGTQPGAQPDGAAAEDHLPGAELTDGERADDERIVALGMALTETSVRGLVLQHLLDSPAAAQEPVLIELTRGLPGRWAAEPAVLLAVSALLRGDGAFATAALDRARAADPTHLLANLLRQAVGAGISPAELRDVLGKDAL